MSYVFHPLLRKSIPIFFLSLFTVSFLLACKGPKPAIQSQDTLPQALLWKIEHKDLPGPSYLFGTIHMIPKADFFLPAGFEEAFANSEKIFFEINMDDMTDLSMMMGMLSGLMMKDGMTLQKLLSPEQYKEVADYFEDMGLPMFLAGKVKPMFLAMIAQVNMSPGDMSSEDIVSYEMELYDKANKASKTVGGLETMAYQMSLFDSIPYKEQAMMLLEAIRGTDVESDMFDQTLEFYQHQNIEAMVHMIGEMQDPSSSDFGNILLHNRNRNWIPIMKRNMAERPSLFAVGAGHLGGDQGVIRLLKKEGYQLTPVSVYKPVTPKRI